MEFFNYLIENFVFVFFLFFFVVVGLRINNTNKKQ